LYTPATPVLWPLTCLDGVQLYPNFGHTGGDAAAEIM
jgi:hypothetical protein